jgi:hypothetical protein
LVGVEGNWIEKSWFSEVEIDGVWIGVGVGIGIGNVRMGILLRSLSGAVRFGDFIGGSVHRLELHGGSGYLNIELVITKV